MGLQELIQEVSARAEQEERRLLSEAHAQAQEILSEAHAQAERAIAQAREEGKLLVREEARKVSSAQLRAKRILAEEREKTINSVLEKLKHRLVELANAKKGEKKALYEKLFAKLAKQALEEIKDGVIYCRKQDFELAKKFARVKAGVECMGGLVVEDALGNVRANNTFEGLLEERAGELKQIAFKKLFRLRSKARKKK